MNNNIFAAIAVKYDYNKYLKQRSPQLFKSIENFITRLEDEKEENINLVSRAYYAMVNTHLHTLK